MRVFVDYKINDSGKGKFLKRLIPALSEIGIKCQHTQRGADVALGIVKWNTETRLPKVLRIDGIHLTGKNETIRKSMNRSNAIIYQSEFAMNYIQRKLKVKCKKVYVIHNGANPDDYDRDKPRSGNLMAANWGNRKHKRLSRHVEYARRRPGEHFYIAGKCKIKPEKNIEMLGKISDKELRGYQSGCKNFVYLASLDWCPNAVVEARVAGMNVIYDEACFAVKELCDLDLNELYINNVARKYKKVFSDVQ